MIAGDESPETVSPEEEEASAPGNVEPSESEERNVSTGSVIQLLEERLRFYQMAEKKAKEENEPGRARRFSRGIKTLKELLHDARAGKTITEADIPPQLPQSAISELTKEVSESSNEGATGIG